MRYQISKILEEIGINSGEDYIPALLRTISMSDGKIYHLDDVGLIMAQITSPLSNIQIFSNYLISTKKSALYIHDLLHVRNQEILPANILRFSLQKTDFEHFADRRLNHLFNIGETITVSNLVLSDS